MKSSVLNGQLAAQFAGEWFVVVHNLYSPAEVAALLQTVTSAPGNGPNFRRNQEASAIRDLLGKVSALWPLLDTAAFRTVLKQLSPNGYHLVKASYFDKLAVGRAGVA